MRKLRRESLTSRLASVAAPRKPAACNRAEIAGEIGTPVAEPDHADVDSLCFHKRVTVQRGRRRRPTVPQRVSARLPRAAIAPSTCSAIWAASSAYEKRSTADRLAVRKPLSEVMRRRRAVAIASGSS
jgi:hypothetical protein